MRYICTLTLFASIASAGVVERAALVLGKTVYMGEVEEEARIPEFEAANRWISRRPTASRPRTNWSIVNRCSFRRVPKEQ